MTNLMLVETYQVAARASGLSPTLYVSTQKYLSGQPNPDPIQRVARKGFGTVQAMWHVGADFKALIISRGAPSSNLSLTGIFY